MQAMPIRSVSFAEKKELYFFPTRFLAGCLIAALMFLVGERLSMALLGGHLGFLCGTASAVYGIYFYNQRIIDRLNASYTEMARLMSTSLKQVDFVHVEWRGTVALDVSNREIALVTASDTSRVNKPLTFSLEKIRSYEAVSPGYDRVKIYGGNLGHRAAANLDNLNESIKAAHQTGLSFELDDIEHPKILIVMPYDYAKAWLLLIEKAFNGSLETRSTPTMYPFGKK
jgi:hypothetical protein